VILAEAPSGRILLMNHQVSDILGLDPIDARTIDELGRYRGFTRDRVPIPPERTALTRAIRHGEVVHDEEILYPMVAGRWITLRVSAAPISDPAGRSVAGVAIFQDISARVRAERLLASQRDVLAMIARGEPLAATLAEISATYERRCRSSPVMAPWLARS
jgi:PAS domain-containing protein